MLLVGGMYELRQNDPTPGCFLSFLFPNGFMLISPLYVKHILACIMHLKNSEATKLHVKHICNLNVKHISI